MRALNCSITRALAVGATAACLLGGCKKKDAGNDPAAASESAEAAPTAEPAPTAQAEAPSVDILPGAEDVRAALAKKEYSGAVERFFSIKGFVVTPEQDAAYDTLYGDLRTALTEAAPRDPKAAQALATFHAVRNGR